MAPILAPDTDSMRQHLELLFGRALAGRVEITAIHTDKASRGVQSRFYDVADFDGAAAFAAEINSEPGWNVYVGAALRIEDVFPGKAATDDDFLRTYVLWADADDDKQLASARAVYRAMGATPPFIVITGRTPTKRAQMWWPLEEPLDDIAALRGHLRGLAASLGTDPKVCTGKQLMRLAGGVNWPKKDDRILERTEIVRVTRASREFPLEQMARAFPPRGQAELAAVSTDVVVAAGGSLGLDEKIMDGREGYAFRLVRAHLHELIGTTGSEPTPDELYRSVAPVFLKKVDQVRAGRGPDFLKQKCSDALRSFSGGHIPFMRTLDEAVATYIDRQGPVAEAVEPPAEGSDEPAQVVAAGGVVAAPYHWIDAARIPPRDMLYGRHLFRKFLSGTVSPGGLGKSSLVMVEALAMVTGRDLLGETPKAQLRAWYWNGEDPMEELQRRMAAACLHYRITEDDLGGRLFVNSGRDTEIIIAHEDRDGLKIATPVVDALIEQVRSNSIDVLIIDPFVASHAVSENDNTKIEAVVRQWTRVADEAGCAIELVHHVRKPNGNGQETTVDDARGAGALLAKVRSARVLNAMTANEANEVGIEPRLRWSFFRVDNGKANLMPRGGDAQWRQMVGVPLGNRIDAQEDNVGVATAWKKPDAFAGIKDQHLAAVKATVAGGEWRLDTQCSNWIGQAVAGALGLDATDPQVRGRVKAMVSVWIKTGVLEVVEMLDAKRMMKRFVVLGKDAE